MIYTIGNQHLTVRISDLGAELHSIKSADGTEYLWQGNPKYWPDRAINLFPICGRVLGQKYTYKGKTYDMSGHGFARTSLFTLAEKAENHIVFQLASNETSLAIYPFDFILRIAYTLEMNNLACRIEVENTGKDLLPFAVGGHPGFNVPLTPGLAFEDYYLEFGEKSSPEKLLLSKTCYSLGKTEPYPLRNGRIIDLRHSLFDNDAIFLRGSPASVTLKSDKDKRSVTLTCHDAYYIGFWHTTKSDAPFVCIEPWRGSPALEGIVDDLMTKPDMTRLPRGESSEFRFDITIV